MPEEKTKGDTLGFLVKHILLAAVPGSFPKVRKRSFEQLEREGIELSDRYKRNEYLAAGATEVLRTGAACGIAYMVSMTYHLYEVFPGL